MPDRPHQPTPPPAADLAHLLDCLGCGQLMALVGHHLVVRHRWVEKLRTWSFAVTGCFSLLIGMIFVALLCTTPAGPIGKGMGWMLLFLPPTPAVIIFFIGQFSPRYRVTACYACGFHRVDRLRWPKPVEQPAARE